MSATATPITSSANSAYDRNSEISLEMPVETPECVRMTYRVAGPSARLGAYLIDLLLKGGIMLFAGMMMACTGLLASGFFGGFFLVILFTVEWWYFALSEALGNGLTVGKRAMGLRTIQKYGYPISWWPAIVRNFLRAADFFMLYGVGFISMLLTHRFQRLGDLAAGTVVIHEKPVRLPTEPVILEKIKPLARRECGSYVPSARTLALIDQFLSRRTNSLERIPHERGHAMAYDLAHVLAEKLNYQGDAEQVQKYSMAFLARVYVTFLRERDEEASDTGTREVNPLATEGATA